MIKLIRIFIFPLVFVTVAMTAKAGPLELDAQLTNDAGAAIKLADFKGKKVVFSMLYPRCTTACPLILAKLKTIRQALEKSGVQAQFVMVSFDSKDESSARLKEYREHMGLKWQNWTFLFGQEKDIRFLSNLVNIRFWQNPKSKEITHDNVILLIGEDGEVKRRLEGLDAKTDELF